MPQNDPYGILASGLPPELAAQARGLTREQAIAEALMQQSQQPLQAPEVKGRFQASVSPLSAIAKIAQAYAGQSKAREGDKKWGELGKQYQTGQSNAMADYIRTRSGDPGRAPVLDPQEVEQQADQGSPAPPNVGAVKADPRGAIQAAMMSPYLKNNPMIQADAKQLQPTVLGRSMVIPATGEVTATDATWQAEQQATRDAREGTAREQREQRQRELEMRLEDARLSREDRANLQRELAQMRADTAKELRAVTAGMRPPPAVTPVTIQDPNNPNATIVIDGRTRQPFGAGPKLTEAGKMESKRQFNMQGIGQAIQRAEDLLTGTVNGIPGAGTKPTGSGVGAIVDKVGGFVGASPQGAAEAAQLEAVGGALVSKVPRMEGPQSDKDLVQYKEMAGKVGDRSQPIATRRAALEEVKNLWAKYERLNPDAFADRRSGGNVVDFNSLPPGR